MFCDILVLAHKKGQTICKTFRLWTAALQDCFRIQKKANINVDEYTSLVASYTSKYIDDVVSQIILLPARCP